MFYSSTFVGNVNKLSVLPGEKVGKAGKVYDNRLHGFQKAYRHALVVFGAALWQGNIYMYPPVLNFEIHIFFHYVQGVFFKGYETSYLKVYKNWSDSDGTYSATSSSLQCKILQRSFNVVVFKGLLLRSLSIVALEIWYLWMSV